MRRVESSGRTTHGCFNMTTQLLTMPSTSDSSWLRRTSALLDQPPLSVLTQPGGFSSFPSSKRPVRPHIYKCRSPNMEVFTCWWHPLSNLTEGEEVNYVLTYSKDKGPKRECPDYTSAGANSCHFDSSHTFIWNIYCMNVTAVMARQNVTSPQHCLDVADIVETEAPVNLTYQLMDPGGDEIGHDVLLSWTYPRPSDLKYGWITLVYELQYRQVSEPDKWKVKQSLREPEVKLLGLPINDYVLRVRCRSQNYGLWSKWSQPLLMNIPSRAQAGTDTLIMVILVTTISMMAILAFSVCVIPQCVR
uniref:Fibronectin type-III domain-containing protein n=1 Tax=Hippocampus comes TaxID=109280 RepID=A0A3Q2XMM1_HIPCM